MLLKITCLTVMYDKVEALKNVSLEVREKEIVCLIGNNGAGKTTLLKTISGIKRARSGEIFYDSMRLDKAPSHDIVKWGIVHVPEGRRMFPAMTVKDNLFLGAYSNADRNEIDKNDDLVYSHFPILKKRAKQMAGSLSGGEQQMLAMGRGLMGSPRILLLDEPSIGLSPLMVKEVINVTMNINREGVTILLVEQNANLALKISNRGYLMESGYIVMQDGASRLLQSDHVKRAFLGS